MSIERIEELETKLDILGRIVAVGWALIAGAFAIGVWVTTLELRARDTAQKVDQHRIAFDEFNLLKSELQHSRYTKLEAAQATLTHNEQMAAHDKRIQRLEDATLAIRESLTRIEKKLDTK